MARLPSMHPAFGARRQKNRLYLATLLIAASLVTVLWLLSTWLLRDGFSNVEAFRWSLLFLVGVAALAILAILALLDRLVLSRQSHRDAERLYQAVVERTADGILLVSGDRHRIVDANRAAERMLGRGARELLGTPFLTLVDVHPEKYAAAMGLLRASDSASLGDARARRSDGSILDVEVTVSAVSLEEPDPLCVVLHDVTERMRAEESMRHHAFHDPLTGLPNRLLFADRLSQAISKARRSGETLGVAYLDLDDFKTVNDTLGHDAGDQLLRQAADRLSDLIRGDDTVSRHGGDEFLLLLTSVGGPESTVLVAERLVERFQEPFEILGQEFVTTASVGIALFPGDGVVAEDLTRNADVAMYHAKKRGRNRVEMYDSGMRERVSASIHLRGRLQAALDGEEFVLHYQPQVRLRDGRVGAVEALVRWHDPERGLVLPSEFVRAAEDNGLILPLGEWVLRRACADARAWAGAGYPDLCVAVNLSPQQVRRQGLDMLIERILSETGCDPRRLQLEIAEGIALQRPDEVRTVLQSLRTLGLTVALDDFGTGHSTLGHLRSLPMDALKIDRDFVANLTLREEDQAIVQGIVGLAHALRLEVVAGGVETRRQLTALRASGCDRVQGFGVCRPVHFQEITQILGQPADLLNGLEDPSRPPPAMA